jgi:hypothetical protein
MDIALVGFFALVSAAAVPGIFSRRFRWRWTRRSGKGSRAPMSVVSQGLAAVLPLLLALAVFADARLRLDSTPLGILACLSAAGLALARGFDTKRAGDASILPLINAPRGTIPFLAAAVFLLVAMIGIAFYEAQ